MGPRQPRTRVAVSEKVEASTGCCPGPREIGVVQNFVSLKLLVLTRGGFDSIWSGRASGRASGPWALAGGADSRVDPFIHVFSMHLSTSSRCSYAPQCPHFDVGFNNKFSTHSTSYFTRPLFALQKADVHQGL